MKRLEVIVDGVILIYSENLIVLWNKDDDELSIVETRDISDMRYEFDRKHLGSVSKTKSNAGAVAAVAVLGAVIAGLISDSEIDIGDVATAGVAGAIVGGSNKNQNMRDEYEEHARVDVYSTSNTLPHLEIDFGTQQKPAKRFLAYIQNAVNLRAQ